MKNPFMKHKALTARLQEAGRETEQVRQELNLALAAHYAAEVKASDLLLNLEELSKAKAPRHRICSILIPDAVALTNLLRRVNPTVRVEKEGGRLVAYSDGELTEGDANSIVAKMTPVVDRT